MTPNLQRSWPTAHLRAALLRLPAAEASAGDARPSPQSMVIPTRHSKALHVDQSLVVGIHGSGKSYWFQALRDPALRERLGQSIPEARLARVAACTAGFGVAQDEAYPSKRELKHLLIRFKADQVWWCVVAWQILADVAAPRHPLFAQVAEMRQSSWVDWVEWSQANELDVEAALVHVDAALSSKGEIHLILFDGLDRAHDDWRESAKIVRGLLKTVLEFRSFKAIRLKVFLRTDMVDDTDVGSFPDASKVMSARVDLDWLPVDLYNLVWKFLANDHEFGARFRDACTRVLGRNVTWSSLAEGAYDLPSALRQDPSLQREIFKYICDEFMGSDPRRGYSYTWLPNHLADAKGRVSPRSFIVGIQAASQHTNEHLRDHFKALHQLAIRKGVVAASQVRRHEMIAEYPWIDLALKTLTVGTPLNVPSEWWHIRQRWGKQLLIDRLNAQYDGTSMDDRRPLPEQLANSEDSVKKGLIGIGVFKVSRDGRFNVPDVYRMAFGLGRKGG